MRLGYRDPDTGKHVAASSVRLALLLRTHKDERTRRAAWEGLRSIETFVLEHGFIDIVRRRNALARRLGHEDFYAWRLQILEGMTKPQLFGLLQNLLDHTEPRTRTELERFSKKHGEGALAPHTFPYLRSGVLALELDRYLRFDAALARWGRSFHALGVRYRGATLTLDLVDRPGKFENGFMHGPGPAFFDRGTWRPARINFTANAIPSQPGGGMRATETLFHEGGHAAHFSNVLSPAPCFSQEFAPTSVAYAETQSMFMDALIGDADWRVRYAQDGAGARMPMELIEQDLREQQPFRGWELRARLTVPYGERALYEIPDAELGPERILEEVRKVERDLTLLEAGVRPVLAVPHLLAFDASAYYHAYILAEMAVEQTRRHFLATDGHLVDNPRVGPALAEHYWAPGNSVPWNDTLKGLTGHHLEPDALIARANADVDEVIRNARDQVERSRMRPTPTSAVDLEAAVRVTHGTKLIATTEDGGFEHACERFASWIHSMTHGDPGSS